MSPKTDSEIPPVHGALSGRMHGRPVFFVKIGDDGPAGTDVAAGDWATVCQQPAQPGDAVVTMIDEKPAVRYFSGDEAPLIVGKVAGVSHPVD
jgi:hypothetical protein